MYHHNKMDKSGLIYSKDTDPIKSIESLSMYSPIYVMSLFISAYIYISPEKGRHGENKQTKAPSQI